MNRITTSALAAPAFAAALILIMIGADAATSDEANKAPQADRELPTAGEARERAKLLHETIHATLHVVHHHYYREDEGLTIPGVALKTVFRELADRRHVQLRWLAVDAQAMNVEHNPRDDFEKQAVSALVEGKEDFELAENGLFRYVGPITLTSECLKCHVPNRMSTNDRLAGLVITMPIKKF